MIRALALLLLLLAQPLQAATSDPVAGHAVTARLIAAEDAVSGGTLSAGLDLRLRDGWKTYWRSPGAVGLPPEIDWSGSENVADVALAFPAPTRFAAFAIENYGYRDEVVYPLAVTLERPGAPVRLRLRAQLLACAEICVPETVELALDLPAGGGIDADSAARLADWIARVPGTDGFALDAVHLDDDALTLRATAQRRLAAPQVFPEHGPYAAFGPPDIRLSGDGRTIWARLPVLGPGEGALDLTLVDGDAAATLQADALAAAAPAPPTVGRGGLMSAIAAALLGGLILNAMPCVLPVLSIKLASALQARDRGPAQVRAGFLAAAAGVLGFFALLAFVVVALRAGGVVLGWGVQFQQPAFLAAMVVLMTLFAVNLFGFFDISLPSGAQTAMGRAGGRAGLWGDVATGAFAAVMATPCSAPFLGGAVAYALTRGAGETVAVFLAMGLGLAAPYLAVAARPSLVRRLPRPGAWMGALKAGLGTLVLIAAVWLLWVLVGAAGVRSAAAVAAIAAATMLALAVWRRPVALAPAGLAAAIVAALAIPAGPAAAPSVEAGWQIFDAARIARDVAAGEIVFVDVTADWCLTCKANKSLVLNRDPVRAALDRVTALRADWTRPDAAIAAYLATFDRYGIPFNAVYGPGAPDGIALPEVLTDGAVLAVIEAAGR